MNNLIHVSVESALRDVLNLDDTKLIDNNTLLKDELGLDSMSSLTFLMTLEESIDGFVVDADNLEHKDLNTVASIKSYIERQLSLAEVAA